MNMKRNIFLLGLSIVLLLGLLGCGNNDSVSGKKSTGKFKEIDSIEVNGYLDIYTFYLSDDGSVLNWGEADASLSNIARMMIWVDGEKEELDFDTFAHFSTLQHSGNMFVSMSDYEKKENHRSLLIYDPRTGETEEFQKTVEGKDIFHVLPGYVSEETGVIAVDGTDRENLNFYLWDYKKDELEMYKLTDDINNLIDEIEEPYHPSLTLSRDAKSLYISSKEGILHYHTETGELNEISMGNGNYSIETTVDSQYAITEETKENDEDIIGLYTYFMTDRDTFESKEIGFGTNIHPITGNKVVIQNENELNLYDPETEETTAFYNIKLGEEEKLKRVAISADGNTIAYAYETKVKNKKEGKTEDKTTIKIIRR